MAFKGKVWTWLGLVFIFRLCIMTWLRSVVLFEH
jgi:hypothetical protein